MANQPLFGAYSVKRMILYYTLYFVPTLPIDSSENRGRFGDLSLSRTYPTTFALPFVYTPNLEKKIEKK